MSYFVDSSVLVAAFSTAHPHHPESIALLQRCRPDVACAATHSLAETYAAITRLPVSPRPMPEHALRYIESIKARFTWVVLTPDEYMSTLHHGVVKQYHGGKIYDALLFSAAQKSNADIIYTWNHKDFMILAKDTAITIKRPDERNL